MLTHFPARVVATGALPTLALLLGACGGGSDAPSLGAAAAPDLALDVPAVVPAFDGEGTELTLAVTHGGGSVSPRSFDLRIAVPEGVAVESAVATAGPDATPSAVACRIGTAVVCESLALDGGEVLEVRLDLRATEGAVATLEATLSSDGPGQTPVEERRSVRLEPRTRMGVPQSLIDAAEDGDTVTLPAGTFVGTLDGRGKRLSIVGADGAAPTVLETLSDAPAIVATGRESVLSNLVLRSTSGYVVDAFGANLSILDSRLVPPPGMAHALADGLIGWRDTRSSYRLEGNRIEGWGVDGNGCAHLINGTGQRRDALYLRRNLFADNACEVLVRAEPEHFSRFSVVNSDITASDNTFDSPETGALFGYGPFAGMHASLDFENNLVLGDTVLVHFDDGPSPGPDGLRRLYARSASNLVFSERVASLSPGALDGAEIEVVSADLRVAPELEDRDGGDYRPRAGSPLVDAGTEPTAYRWYSNWRPCSAFFASTCDEEDLAGGANDDRESYPQPGSGATPPPVDGDGDGTAEHDIGAFEFTP